MASSTTTDENVLDGFKLNEVCVPQQLKFLMNSIRGIINTQLSSETYPIWRLQVSKLFSANGFEGFLHGNTKTPKRKTR